MTRRRATAPVALPTRAAVEGRVHVTVDGLLILDEGRRTYAGPSRESRGWHLIQPARADHHLVRNGTIPAGSLVCTCEGGVFNGQCWRLEQARAFEERAWNDLWSPTTSVAAVQA